MILIPSVKDKNRDNFNYRVIPAPPRADGKPCWIFPNSSTASTSNYTSSLLISHQLALTRWMQALVRTDLYRQDGEMSGGVSGASTALDRLSCHYPATPSRPYCYTLYATDPLMSPNILTGRQWGTKILKCYQTFLLTTSLWLNTQPDSSVDPDTFKQFLLPSGVSGTQEAADDGCSNHPNSSKLIRDEACVRGGRIATKSIGRYSIQRPYRDSVKLTEKICLTLNNL